MKQSHLKFDYELFNKKNLSKILSKYKDPSQIHILYLSTYHECYTRTESLLNLFDKLHLNYTKIIKNGFLKYFKVLLCLIKNQKKVDVIFVAFRGQELLPFLKLFTKKPIIFDAFISVYDTLCLDRKYFKPNSFAGNLFKWYDKFLCKISDSVLVDTKVHQRFFQNTFKSYNIEYLYVGCNQKLFVPFKNEINFENKTNEKTIKVFWYGSANPLQGVNVILHTAKLLESEKRIKFKLAGPVKNKNKRLLKKLACKNIEFVNFIPYKELPKEMNRADIFLGGHFSNIDKAQRVIAGKTYQALCCNKITIVGDNPANRELFNDMGLVAFVKMNNPIALASKIRSIANERQ
jgi:glycosyltransferase involved in cell wall biosynthesis